MRAWSARVAVALMVLGAGACATTSLPPELRQNPEGAPSLTEVRASPQANGTAVRWGGAIANVEPGPGTTTLEIVALPLRTSGKPMDTDSSEGRFCHWGRMGPIR